MARYADACNLFPGPQVAHKLDVLKRHCEAEGRDYGEIEKTCLFTLDVGERGVNTGKLISRLRWLASMGVQTVVGSVPAIETLRPLEIISRELIPAVADLQPR